MVVVMVMVVTMLKGVPVRVCVRMRVSLTDPIAVLLLRKHSVGREMLQQMLQIQRVE